MTSVVASRGAGAPRARGAPRENMLFSLARAHVCYVRRPHVPARPQSRLSTEYGILYRGTHAEHARLTSHDIIRGDMVIFINAKNTQTTAWRVLTEPTEHTCKALASVEAKALHELVAGMVNFKCRNQLQTATRRKVTMLL